MTPAAGRFGPYEHPCATLIFGPAGTGKSSATWATFAGRILWIGPPGGLKSASGLWAYPPPPKSTRDCWDIEAATALVRAVAASPKLRERFIAIGVDDISVLVDRLYDRVKEEYAKKDTFAMWDHLLRAVRDFAVACREGGFYVVATAHLAPPNTDTNSGTFHRGGPAMPGKKLVAQVPHLFDISVRTQADDEIDGKWKIVWSAENGSPLYHEKDRHNVIPTRSTDSLFEILRAAQYPIPRPPGLEWFEPYVEALAGALDAGKERRDVNRKIREKILAKSPSTPIQHVYWIVRDGYARHQIRAGASSLLDSYL